MTTNQLNNILGDRLGRNPSGEPVYKWINSDNWFHLMRKIDDFEERRSEGGLILIEPKFIYRKMIEADDIWVLAHWNAPISEHQWIAQNGSKLMWPREGWYSPTDIYLEPGLLPSEAVTDEVTGMVNRNRAKSYADHLADSEAIVERREKRTQDMVNDIIDDATSAFCNVPGTRSAHVSFPSVETKEN